MTEKIVAELVNYGRFSFIFIKSKRLTFIRGIRAD